MRHLQEWLLPLAVFLNLSQLSEPYRGKLVRQISIIPFEIFNDIWYTYISGEDGVSYARMDAPPSYAFQLSPLNKTL